MSGLLERVLLHEGFEAKPYQDHLGNWTFGHGLTFITKEESEYIVDKRLTEFAQQHIHDRPWLRQRPPVVLEVITEMAYQMGYLGTQKFTKMWAGIYSEDYVTAAIEMLDSRWANQTPERANELADLIREAA